MTHMANRVDVLTLMEAAGLQSLETISKLAHLASCSRSSLVRINSALGRPVRAIPLHRLNEGADIATDRFQNTDPAIPEFVKARTGYLLETLHDTD